MGIANTTASACLIATFGFMAPRGVLFCRAITRLLEPDVACCSGGLRGGDVARSSKPEDYGEMLPNVDARHLPPDDVASFG